MTTLIDMRLRSLMSLGLLCSCSQVLDLKVPVTRVSVSVTGRCTTGTTCSKAAITMSQPEAGGAENGTAFAWPDVDLATVQLRVCDRKPTEFVVFDVNNGTLSAKAVGWNFESFPVRTQRYDRLPYFGRYALYGVAPDGTATIPEATDLWPVLAPVSVDGGTRVYEFQLTRAAEDGGTELDPDGLVIRETHTISSAVEDVQVEYIPSCPTPTTPSRPSGSWLW